MSTRPRSTLYILIKVLFYSFWLNSCVTADHPPRVDPRAAPYLDTFVRTAAAYGYYPDASRIQIEITDDVDPESSVGDGYKTVGICYHFLGDLFPPQVLLNEDYWFGLNAYGKEALIYHELGHCLLHEFEHRNADTYEKGLKIPASAMNEVVVNSVIYKEFRTYYLTELFAHAAPDVPRVRPQGYPRAALGE